MIGNIVAVVVTFYPDLQLLDLVVSSILSQVRYIVIIDNSGCSLELGSRYTDPLVQVVSMGSNKGIAAAHNAGILVAKKLNAEFVMLLDQDSVPESGMVLQLLGAIASNKNAACAGPRYLDARQKNPPPFIRVEGINMIRCECIGEYDILPVDYLISSGCLIPMAVLDKVGVMREDLFIDYVDIEWGLRAKRHGFQSYGVCSAHMGHSLGESPINFLGKQIPLHSPLRHYYHFRNAVALYKEPWVPLNWKLVDGYRLLLKYIFYSLFAKPRLTQLHMMTLGVWHGFTGALGPYMRSNQRKR